MPQTSAILATALFVVLACSTFSTADAQTTGSVRFEIAKAGFIFGIGGGTGVLVFRGRSYPLRVGGISAGTIGVAKADLVGTASNLRSPSDIVGSYSAVSAGIAVAGGPKTARLQNANGVVLELRGKQVGLEVSLNLGGMEVALQR